MYRMQNSMFRVVDQIQQVCLSTSKSSKMRSSHLIRMRCSLATRETESSLSLPFCTWDVTFGIALLGSQVHFPNHTLEAWLSIGFTLRSFRCQCLEDATLCLKGGWFHPHSRSQHEVFRRRSGGNIVLVCDRYLAGLEINEM